MNFTKSHYNNIHNKMFLSYKQLNNLFHVDVTIIWALIVVDHSNLFLTKKLNES